MWNLIFPLEKERMKNVQGECIGVFEMHHIFILHLIVSYTIIQGLSEAVLE